MTNIPAKGSIAYEEFYANELDKIKYGVTIDGVYIHGWLYWHLNYWKIETDILDAKNNSIVRGLTNPTLRDNEWMIAKWLKQAEDDKKGLCVIGARRVSKSVFMSSYIGRSATIYEGSENVIVGNNKHDLGVLTSLLEKGLTKIDSYFFAPRLTDDWKKEVTLGYKDKSNKRYIHSTIFIRNTDTGSATEVVAGTTPKSLIFDEALEENSLVYTEKDCILIKDIQVGDKIYGSDGRLTTVLEKYYHKDVPTYRITLLDGRIIEASHNHIWTVKSNVSNKIEEKTTEQLLKSYIYKKFDKRYDKYGQSYTYGIPNTQPINYPKRELDIDPYYLGLWLGDGFSDSTAVCSIDDEIINYCEDYFNSLNLDSTITYDDSKKNKNYRVINSKKRSSRYNKLRDLLANRNLKNNKHIPTDYLLSSIEDRLALLQGLMDTDGSIDSQGHIEFTTSNPVLARDFKLLTRSLGISLYEDIRIPTFHHKGKKRKGKLSHRFQLYTTLKICRLPRKLINFREEVNKKANHYKNYVSIKDIQSIGNRDCYCIKVDNKDKLFLTTDFITTHNCGKSKFLDVFSAARPSFASQYGWRCVPIIVGTGGDFENGQDAEKMFNDPDGYNMVSMELPEEGNKKTCIFIPGPYALEFPKDKTTLGAYLNAPEGSELYDIPFEVTNIERSTQLILAERERLAKAKDGNTLLKYKMYYPLTSDECFLTETGNNFPVEAAKMALDLIERKPELQGTPTRLYRDVDNKILATRDDKRKFIWDYPHSPTGNLDAPIMIWEPPMKNPPLYLYIAGIDPYNTDVSVNSNSLGTCYIYKRIYDVVGGTFQQRIVASYSARPGTMKEWHENVEMLLEYYNAVAMIENAGTTFIQYLDSKNKGHMLADGFSLLTEISPNTTIKNKPKGLPPTVPVIRHCMNLFVEHCKEEVILGYDDKGEAINALGVARIPDPVLLKEIIKYQKGANVDRCFLPDQKVLSDKGFINIQDCTLDNTLFTKEGNYQKITELLCNEYSGEIFNIKCLGEPLPVKVTPNHPFYISNISKKRSGKDWNNYKNCLEDYRWVESKDLKKGDYLFIPFNSNKKDLPEDLNEEILYLIGWYLSDGNISNKRLRITFQGDQLNMAEYVKTLLEKYDKFEKTEFYVKHHITGKVFKSFSSKAGVTIYKIAEKNAYALECTSNFFNSIVNKYITVLPGGEKVLKDTLLNCSDLLPLLLGFLEGDGHQKRIEKNNTIKNCIEVSGSYHNLMYQIRHILLNNKIWCTMNYVSNKNSKYNSKSQLRIDIQDWEGINRIVENSLKFQKIIDPIKQKSLFILKEDGYWVPISKIEIVEYTGKVYNFEVEKSNTYTISNICTHNCVAFRHILAFDKYLEKNYSTVYVPNKEHKKLEVGAAPRSPFGTYTHNPFGSGKTNLFELNK